MYVPQETIFQSTNNGLDVILWLYPNAAQCIDDLNKKFKARADEKTASAKLSFFDGIYWVTDFGGDGKPHHAIKLVMIEQNVDYAKAIEIIATRFNIQPTQGTLEPPKAQYEFCKRPATDEEEEGQYYLHLNKEFQLHELRALFSNKIMQQCEIEATPNADFKTRYASLMAVLKTYHYHSVNHYIKIKNREAHIYTATEAHPIFVIDEKKFKKLYQPLHPNKSYRFLYIGDKPKYFVHGKENITKQYNAINPQLEEPANETEKETEAPAPKIKKLDGIILCTGGSDAINVAAILNPKQYCCIWLNSESQKITTEDFNFFKSKAYNVYNLHDIDKTGLDAAHQLSLQFLDIKNIQLPMELLTKKDWRGNPCKDVRDYLNHYNLKSFKRLIDTALPYEFWIEKPRFKKDGDPVMVSGRQLSTFEANNVALYNFLHKNGFNKFKMNGDEEDYYIAVKGNIVKQVQPKDARAFINDFLEERGKPVELRNSFYRSTQLSESSLSNLKYNQLDFKDFGRNFQFMFFDNELWKVTADKIEKLKHGFSDKYIWMDEVIPHRVEILDPFFKIEYNHATDSHSINVLNNNCLFFRYLINASRVYWRDELEENIKSLSPEEQAAYRATHKFEIAGPNLLPEQKDIQQQHLVNKIFSIGYLLHRYKDQSRAWCVLAVDNKNSPGGEAHGGSGKSICYEKGLRHVLRKNFYKDGKNKELTKDKHMLQGLTEYHRYMIIDDADRYLEFERFFGMITGDMEVNPKTKAPYSIPFEKAAKMCITTNYPLRNLSPSVERRLLYVAFSDYYHHNKHNEYNETRQVSDDFEGRNLFADYTEHEWNMFLNFCAQCLQFYLSCQHKVNPPMDSVEKRQMLEIMGEDFREWADVYFAESDETPDHENNVNKDIPRNKMYDDFKEQYKQTKISTRQKFKKALEHWCRYNKVLFNPSHRNKDDRTLKTIEGKTVETFAVVTNEVKYKTQGTPF